MTYVTKSLATLKANGYKSTTPRKSVLNVISRAKKPLSAYDIKKKLDDQHKLEAITIYRILDVLESLHLVHKVVSKGGFIPCQSQEEIGCHHFLVCEQCEDVQEIVLPHHKTDPEAKKIMSNLGFIPSKHVHEIQGTCRECI